MCWFHRLAAVAALVAAAGGCGQSITVPDQGVVVPGCEMPNACFRTNCPCNLGVDMGLQTDCIVEATACAPGTDMFCNGCPEGYQCLEVAQACVGRGPFCGGVGALCMPQGSSCAPLDLSIGTPPMMVQTGAGLEPHCQFADDVCCPGTDAGVPTD